MAISKREKRILYFAIFAIIALLLNSLIINPYLEYVDYLDMQKVEKQQELVDINNLIKKQKRYQAQYNNMIDIHKGKLKSSAENEAITEIKNYVNQAELRLVGLKPEHTRTLDEFQEFIISIQAEGGIDTITKFIYQIETSQLPFKINNLELITEKNSIGQIKLQSKISIIYKENEQI
ncbi:hypothetical protein JD969_17690 [Planctomycetota bacterium]|nr:hypothetical protein JD969_17690 [Planctomycetota bacterium]